MAKMYLIGNAHIDPVWLWRWQEGFGEILATFRSALDRLKEFPDMKFSSACALYYQWIEKLDKEMFDEIRQRVKEGRWNIVGGWFLQPDCNIPCGESFVRHGLIAQRYFLEKFGTTAKTGYNVDSFGHNASLPQILKKSGMDNYVFMRPSQKEQGKDMDVFLWESADGSQVIAYRIPFYYNFDLSKMEKFRELKEKAEKKNRDLMAFYGVGNHGGGPTIKLIDAINHLEIPDMIHSTPDEYFATIDRKSLPVMADELQHHARGCYSACSFVKANNRKCENNLLAAEKLLSMAKHLVGIRYPMEKLDKAWKNLLFNQFHDVMGGCAIKKAYEDAGYLYGEIMSITEQEIHYAMRAISHGIDTLRGETLPSYKDDNPLHWHIWEHEMLGTPVVVFNPHAWTVRMTLEINVTASKMTDRHEKEIPFQIVRGDQTNGERDKYHTVFTAEVEPMGYSVYRIYLKREGTASFERDLSVTATDAEAPAMENSRLRVEFSRVTGDIRSIFDKESGKYLLKGDCGAVLLDETDCDTWAHDKEYLGEAVGWFEAPEFSVIEDGPVRAVLRVKSRYHDSVLQRDYILETGFDAVRVKAVMDFREKHRTLKFTFPAAEAKTVAKIPFGTILRENGHGEESMESWIANGRLCIANDSKYGYDTTEREIRLTILRSAIYADHFGVRDEFCEYMEQGIQEFSYMLYPYSGNAEAERKAMELNFPLRCILESFHDGKLPEAMSCLACDAENIVITAVKQSQDDDLEVVRFYEAGGEDAKVSLHIFDKRIEAGVSHNEIKTFRTDGTEVNLIEW